MRKPSCPADTREPQVRFANHTSLFNDNYRKQTKCIVVIRTTTEESNSLSVSELFFFIILNFIFFERFPDARWIILLPPTFLSSTRLECRTMMIGRNFSIRRTHRTHTHVGRPSYTIGARTRLHYAHGRKRRWSFYLVFDITRVLLLLLRAAGALTPSLAPYNLGCAHRVYVIAVRARHIHPFSLEIIARNTFFLLPPCTRSSRILTCSPKSHSTCIVCI